jgi:hypothetical protein
MCVWVFGVFFVCGAGSSHDPFPRRVNTAGKAPYVWLSTLGQVSKEEGEALVADDVVAALRAQVAQVRTLDQNPAPTLPPSPPPELLCCHAEE